MKTHINYNRWIISSKEIKEHQNFKKIIEEYQKEPTPFFKSIGFWGRIGVSCIFLVFLIYHF